MRVARERLAGVAQFIDVADQNRQAIVSDPNLDDNPISKVLVPAAGRPAEPDQWYAYRTRVAAGGHLTVDAQHSPVIGVSWLSDGKTVKVRLEAHPDHEYACSTLDDVSSAQQEAQVRAGDLAILVGYYMIIAEQPEEWERDEPHQDPDRAP